MYLVTRGCSPMLFTLFTEVTDDTADLAVLIELYPSPDWKSESKKSTNKLADGLYGSAFLLPQNCSHLVRWTLYCFWVDCRQDEMRMSVAWFDIPVRPTISLISETLQVWGFLSDEVLLDPLVTLVDFFSSVASNCLHKPSVVVLWTTAALSTVVQSILTVLDLIPASLTLVQLSWKVEKHS